MMKKTDTKDTQKIRRDMTLLAGIDFVTNKVGNVATDLNMLSTKVDKDYIQFD
jgi:hypothetical protein